MQSFVCSLPASGAHVRDYVALLKPRVMGLVVFTGGVGMWMAPVTRHLFLQVLALLCIAVGAGASAVLNMVWDRDMDALMERTRNRPIPAGRIEPQEALAFGVCLAVLSVLVMGLGIGIEAAFWLAVTILFYSVFYTLILKRRTPQNIVIGGAAGALPPVIGWVSMTGSVSEPLPWMLFMLIFLWTPPHFWALALFRTEDYRRAQIPMLPVVASVSATVKQIALYTVLLILFSGTPWACGFCGVYYGIAACALGLSFGLSVIKLWRYQNEQTARFVFRDSIIYLFFLFLSLLLDKMLS